MNSPQVSVIIPVYNGAAFICEALDSIAVQHYPALEIIVVDDGSTDDTRAVVQAYSAGSPIAVNYLGQENRGPAAARNRAIAAAQGQVFAFLDADDLWTPDKLAVQIPLLEEPEPVDVLMGSARFFKRTARSDGSGIDEEISAPSTFLGFQVAICRRKVFDQVGLLNESLRTGEDTDWFMRVREAGVKIKIHPEVVLLYRRHEQNLTRRLFGDPTGMLPLLRQSLQRRRQNPAAAEPVEPRQPDD